MIKRCLIVGDGNFSYSLAFSSKHSQGEWCIIATSLEEEEEVTAHFGAGKNIRLLQNFGNVQLLHGIDGTRLEHYSFSSTGYFQQIIFNFPHCGGKSDIKCNRSLIRNFFISSSKILDPAKGEIRVTLCKGQGGTQADDLSRGYENSWKIVEQAAEGGLILSEVFPFKASDWPGYSQTGYRSSNKGFILDGAITHVFTCPRVDKSLWKKKSNPYALKGCQSCRLPTELTLVQIPLELCSYECFDYPLLDQEWHPVARTRDSVVNALQSLLSKRSLSFRTEATDSCTNCFVHKANSQCLSGYSDDGLITVDATMTDGHVSDRFSTVFESNLEQHLVAALSSHPLGMDCDWYIASGTCIRRPVLPPSPSPSLSSSSSQGIAGYYRPLVNHQLVCVSSSYSLIREICTKVLHELLLNVDDDGTCCTGSVDLSKSTFTLYSEHLISKDFHCHPGKADSTASKHLFCCSFDLDRLALERYAIPDIRLLWSKDSRFYQQYTSPRLEGIQSFKPFSYFPPKYVHDISFWIHKQSFFPGEEAPTANFDSSDLQLMVKMKLCSFIRSKCDMTVVSLDIIDVYSPPTTVNVAEPAAKVSFCCRLVYSLCDQPISFAESRSLQEQLRAEIEANPGWELR